MQHDNLSNIYMKKFFLVPLLFFVLLNVQGQSFNPLLAAMLQDTLNTYVSQISNIKGMSAAVHIPGQGIWTGVSGNSYSGHPITSDMRMGIASNTKLFVSTVMLILAENNHISLDDSLSKWLPNYNNINPNIKIRQLLNHSSGVSDPLFVSPWMDTIKANPTRVFTPNEVLGWVGAPLFPVGTSYGYSNINYVLAGMIAENATGYHISQLIRDSVLTPLNMDSTFYDVEEPASGTIAHRWWNLVDYNDTSRVGLNTAAGCAGSLFSTASEMTQWYNALFNGQILSPASMTELTTFIPTGNPTYRYGLGLSRDKTQNLSYWGHGGSTWGYRSKMIYDTCLHISVCGLTNSFPSGMESVTFLLYRAVKNHIPGCSGPLSGITTVCQGTNSVVYTVPPIPNATSYLWILPSGASGTSSTNTININYGGNAVSGTLIVRGVNNYGAGGASSLWITVNPTPPIPSITQNGNTLASSSASGNQWLLNGQIIGGATGQTYNPLQNGNYQVSVTLSGCASISASYAYTNCTMAISGNAYVCSGTSTTLSINIPQGAGNCTYQWQSSTNGSNWSNINGAISTSYTTPPVSSVKYYRVVTNCSVCGYTTSQPFVVSPTTVTITGGPQTICSGNTVSLSVSNILGGGQNCTYQWQVSSNGTSWTNLLGQTTPNYSSTPLTATRYFRVMYNCSASGCGIVYSNILPVIVNPTPSIVMNPVSTTVCTGGTKTLQASASVGGSSYSWSPATGLNTTSGSSVIASPQVTTTYTVTATSPSGCAKTNSVIVTVVPDAYVSAINGNTNLCSGSTTLLTATVTGGSGTCNVTWQSSTNGTSWNNVTIPNSPTLYVGTTLQTAVLTANIYYRARVTGCSGSGCGASGYSSPILVTVVPDPAITISGNATQVCNNGSVVLTATVTGGTGNCPITWQLSTDGINWNNTGGNSANLPVYNITSNRFYRAIINCNGSGCDIDTSNTLSLSVVANPIVSISGGGTYNSGSPVTLTSTVTGGSGICTYTWFSRPNAQTAFSVIPNANAATYSFNASSTAQYRVQAFCNSCPSIYSNILTVSVLPPARYANDVPEGLVPVFSLYPNPASALVKIEGKELNSNEVFSIKLTDALGQVLGERQDKTESGNWTGEWDVAPLPAGIYYFRIQQGDFSEVIKIAVY